MLENINNHLENTCINDGKSINNDYRYNDIKENIEDIDSVDDFESNNEFLEMDDESLGNYHNEDNSLIIQEENYEIFNKEIIEVVTLNIIEEIILNIEEIK